MKIFNPFPSIMKIGVWGPPSSGKTTYMIMLQFADDRNDWKIKPLGEDTQDIFVEGTDLMRDKRKFVAATPLETKYLTFDFEGPSSNLLLQQKQTFRVIIPEAPGEFYEKPKQHPELVDELSRYQGILWLIDPEQIDNPKENRRSYRSIIQEWLFKLYEKQGTKGSLKQHMAFCLTKMDLPNHYPHINTPKDYCLDKLGEDVQNFIETFCDLNKVGFFATSSIGVNQNKDTNLDLSDPNKLKLASPAKPINLFQPLHWLFDSI